MLSLNAGISLVDVAGGRSESSNGSGANRIPSYIMDRIHTYTLGNPEITANKYCKSRNLPNADTQNCSTDLR